MVRLQQQLGAQGGVVMEGRDIGTVVFPHAEVKIFLDAAPEVRGSAPLRSARTRKPPCSQEEVIRDLRARDERDRNRADSPLKPAAGRRCCWIRRISHDAGGGRSCGGGHRSHAKLGPACSVIIRARAAELH
jgi:hypothetical protein